MGKVNTIEYIKNNGRDTVILSYLGCDINYIIGKKLSNVHHVDFHIRENVYNVHVINSEHSGMKLMQCSDLIVAYHNTVDDVNSYKYSFNITNKQLSLVIPSLFGKYKVQRLSCIKCRKFDPMEYPTNILYLNHKEDSITLKLLS